jgi:predicted enzyme related to lactoylglutathione lyase
MNPVVHFEMPAENMQRMTDFYTEVFGWQSQMMGEEMGSYVVVTTSETDDKDRPKMPGTINGGFYPKHEGKPPYCPSFVIAVDDINESIKKIERANGKVLGDPVEIPGVGTYISFIDTEGNRLNILKPLMNSNK